MQIETARLPNGRSLQLEVVKHPGGAVVVALNDASQVCLLRQYRHVADKTFIWELPAGCIDPDDTMPLDTAKRELREEAGIIAGQWSDLGAIRPSPGYCDEVLYLYLARELTLFDTRQQEDEVIEVHWLDFKQAVAMAAKGDISDAKSVAGLFRAAIYSGIDLLEGMRTDAVGAPAGQMHK